MGLSGLFCPPLIIRVQAPSISHLPFLAMNLPHSSKWLPRCLPSPPYSSWGGEWGRKKHVLPPFEGISRKFCSFIPLVRTESCSIDSCKVYSETFGFFFSPPGSYVPPKVKRSNCCGGERRGFETLPHHKHETLHSSML